MRKHVLLYGTLAGVLIANLEFIEYRWLLVEHSIEIYSGVVAAIGLDAGLIGRMSDWNWHRYSSDSTAVNVVDHTVGA